MQEGLFFEPAFQPVQSGLESVQSGPLVERLNS